VNFACDHRDRSREPVAVQPCQDIKTVQLALLINTKPIETIASKLPKKEQKLTSLLCSVLTF
jgi:hypothetical protein